LYSSPDINRAIKPGRVRRVDHMGEIRNGYKILVGKFIDLGAGGRILIS
jgi:hypothetical protein